MSLDIFYTAQILRVLNNMGYKINEFQIILLLKKIDKSADQLSKLITTGQVFFYNFREITSFYTSIDRLIDPDPNIIMVHSNLYMVFK
jgi:hypothetical protein